MAVASENWHLDRRVPIALIATIAMQTGMGIWWASSMSERMSQIERRENSTSLQAQESSTRLADQAQKVAVLSEAVANTNRNLERLQGELSSTNALLREMIMRDVPAEGGGR